MNFVMDEAEFFFTHEMVVYHLNKHPGYIKRLITAMKFPSLVVRQSKAVENEPDPGIDDVPNSIQPSTSNTTMDTRKSKGKISSRKRKGSVEVKPTMNFLNPLLYHRIVDTAESSMQTEDDDQNENDLIEGEEEFQRDLIDELREQMMIDVIREEDFANEE